MTAPLTELAIGVIDFPKCVVGQSTVTNSPVLWSRWMNCAKYAVCTTGKISMPSACCTSPDGISRLEIFWANWSIVSTLNALHNSRRCTSDLVAPDRNPIPCSAAFSGSTTRQSKRNPPKSHLRIVEWTSAFRAFQTYFRQGSFVRSAASSFFQRSRPSIFAQSRNASCRDEISVNTVNRARSQSSTSPFSPKTTISACDFSSQRNIRSDFDRYSKARVCGSMAGRSIRFASPSLNGTCRANRGCIEALTP